MQRPVSGPYNTWHYLATAFLLLVLGACSSSKTSTLIPINPAKRPNLEVSEPHSGDRSFVELKSTTNSGESKGYVTALRTCGYDKKTSLRGTTRQIFVGLEQVKITQQEAAEFPPHRLWHVHAEAQSEGLPIDVSTYTLKKDQCFIDFVLWTVRSENPDAYAAELTDLRKQFHQLVGETLPTL